MKITRTELQKLIKEEMSNLQTEANAKNLADRIKSIQDRLEKLQKKMKSTNSPVQKQMLQGRMSRALQRLSDIRKDLTGKRGSPKFK